jgi:hypothetical protein
MVDEGQGNILARARLKTGPKPIFGANADTVIRLRVPRSVGIALKQIAHENAMSRSDLIRDAVDEAIESYGHKRLLVKKSAPQ